MTDKEFFTSYPHADAPPFKVMPSGGENDWYYVENANGFNCLSDSGRVFTSKENATRLCAVWNEEK